MNFKYNSETKLTEIGAETDDICLFCSLLDYCPFIGALETNLVYPSADRLTIEDCPIYEPIDLADELNNNS